MSRRVSRSAMRPRYSISIRSTLERLGEADPDAAERAGERQERAEHVHVLGADRRDVDGGGDDAAGERGDDLLGGLHAGAVLRLGGRGRQVRRDDHVGIAEQRVVGDRLAGEHVERGAGDLAGVQRRLERVVVDELAARAVDDAHAVAALGQRLGVEPALGLGRLRQVDRDEVRLRVQVVGGLGLLDAELAEPARPRRTGRTRRRACRSPARGRPRAGRCGRSRAARASSRRARPRPTCSAPSGRRRARRAPAGRFARARAASRPCARRR